MVTGKRLARNLPSDRITWKSQNSSVNQNIFLTLCALRFALDAAGEEKA
jgi:hypothetical protein